MQKCGGGGASVCTNERAPLCVQSRCEATTCGFSVALLSAAAVAVSSVCAAQNTPMSVFGCKRAVCLPKHKPNPLHINSKTRNVHTFESCKYFSSSEQLEKCAFKIRPLKMRLYVEQAKSSAAACLAKRNKALCAFAGRRQRCFFHSLPSE